MAIYWGYDFKNLTVDTVPKGYNWRIGDVALQFLFYFLGMERQKLNNGKSPSKRFIPDLVARLVRIVDILIAMSKLNNRYINNIYFREDDLALNFLEVQCHNPWLRNAFSVVKNVRSGKNVFQFYHEVESIKFYAFPTRMVKKTAFNDLCSTLNDLYKLYRLETRRYIRTSSSIKTPEGNTTPKLPSPTYKFVEHVTELSEELIYEDVNVPADADADTKAEAGAKAKVCARHTKPVDAYEDDTAEAKEYVIPNGHVQNKRNKAFSSSLTKQNLLLPSDYNIPPLNHLKEFIKFLVQGVQDV